MDIIDYIKKYGDYSFEEKEFNEVDNAIFSCLAYINFEGIVSNDFNNKKTIHEVAKEYFDNNISKHEITAVRSALSMLKYVMNEKRYKDILVYNYMYISNYNCQFGAISFDLDEKTTYVSYEGTDDLISGWREDCNISYIFPVPAQKFAIKYLNKFLLRGKKLIVGGHSKGGNLAIVASMYCNYFVKRKIIKIYSNDGLGLRKEELESKKYNSIKDKVIKLIPSYSIVGHLLYSDPNYIIIKSSKKSLYSHNVSTWIIDDDIFQRDNISKSSMEFKESIDIWLEKYDIEAKKKFTDSLFYICDYNGITSLRELKGKKSLFLKLILNSRLIDNDVKDMVKDLYHSVIEVKRNHKKDEKE